MTLGFAAQSGPHLESNVGTCWSLVEPIWIGWILLWGWGTPIWGLPEALFSTLGLLKTWFNTGVSVPASELVKHCKLLDFLMLRAAQFRRAGTADSFSGKMRTESIETTHPNRILPNVFASVWLCVEIPTEGGARRSHGTALCTDPYRERRLPLEAEGSVDVRVP